MLKKLLKSILKNSVSKKHYSSSDNWKRHKHHNKYSSMGHHHYKRKHRSRSFSSFFSS